MKAKYWSALVSRYQAALAAYVAREDEEALQRAYELGRKALNLGLGVVDVVRLHQEALVKLVSRGDGVTATPRWAGAIETFLMETLSAFEVAHRGFRDACDRLQRLNDTLKERHQQLAVSIKKLGQEVARRKNAQELLQESELKFRSVVESAQDGIITVDSRGRLVAMNHAAEMLFGYRREELVGKSFTRLIPRPLRAAALFTLKSLAEGGEQQHLKRPIQSVGLHRDGSDISLEFTLASWRTRTGVFFTGVIRDIRERKQAELALRESRDNYIRLFKEARAMEENLRQLSNKVLTVQEEERKHISRELHDEIGQALTAVNVSIAMLRTHAAGDEVFRKKVDTAQKLLEQSMDMVHRFARELRPSMLDHLGPVAALQSYVKTFTERTGIKTELEGSVSVEQLNNQQGTVLYRIAQESLTNVFKHAHATRVKIRLRQLPRAVCMEIADNGRAFSVPTPTNGNGRQPLGLLGMQERVRLVNGQFAIESVPKRGTTVRVQIPLPPPHTPVAVPASEPAEHAPLASN
jgi:PAS domain S-box-containing protein